MSDQTFADITNAIAPVYRPQIVRTVNRRSAALRLLPIRKATGPNCNWDWEGSGAYAETWSDGDAVTTFGSDTINPAVLSFAGIRANYRIGKQALAAARATPSPTAINNLLGRNYMNGVMRWASVVNGKLFNSTSGIIGLDYALRDDNTYATVVRGSNATFRGNLIHPASATALTLELIRKDLAVTIFRACGEVPDIAICAPEVYNKIGSLFNEVRRYVQPVTEITTARGKITLDGSLGGIEFEGCVFFKDKDATANSLYYLNTNHVNIDWLDLRPMNPEIAGGVEQPVDDGLGDMPMGLYCEELARNGGAYGFTAGAMLQLVVESPVHCGLRDNIDVT